MSNRVDVCVGDEVRRSLPAKQVSAYIGGEIHPELIVEKITYAGYPHFSSAKLRLESLSSGTYSGPVSIRQVINETPGQVGPASIELFSGWIDEYQSTIGGDSDETILTAHDVSALLTRITVSGRRVLGSDGQSVFITGGEVVFNPDGIGNAAVVDFLRDGRQFAVFASEQGNSRQWYYAEVIRYLCLEYAGSMLEVPEKERIESLCERQIARDLDVTGLSLIDALHRCCGRIGLQFQFAGLDMSSQRSAIMFYRTGRGPRVHLSIQDEGEALDAARTNICSVRRKGQIPPVTQRYIGQGDYKVFEATFDLAPAWDPALETTDYNALCPGTNPGFNRVRDVYRKWCLNEAGDYSGPPYNRGEPFDFANIFETPFALQVRRRFWPALTRDTNGKSLGYYLEVSYDDGAHWWQYLHAFNNLLDECGIWLSAEHFDFDTWWAALKGELRFRITASVIADERLTAILADGPVGSAAAVSDRVFALPRQFKYKKVSSGSIFFKSTDASLGKPDEVDDSAGLMNYVRRQMLDNPVVSGSCQIETPYIVTGCRPGCIISSNERGGNLLGIDSANVLVIDESTMDFERQCTVIKASMTRAAK
jgi:hypothetical protein